ncbi:MAG: hypothetical protein WC119_01290 [Synergistaceae bacterium]
MVRQDRTVEIMQLCLKEMFMRVGENFPNENLTSKDKWYIMHSWTIEEEENFKRWMISCLRRSLRWTKERAMTETAMFLLQWGWTNISPFYCKGILK